LTRVITAGLLLILATAPLGDGGRAADLLFVHQSLVALLCICAMHMKRASRLPRTGLLATLALFAVFAMMTSSYRYATMLVLADVVTAAAIVVLASMVSERWRLVVAAIAVGAATNVVAGVGQALAGQPVHGLFANAHHGACLVAAATACLIAARPTGRRALRLMHLGAIVAGGGFVVAIASRGATLALLVGGAVALVTTRRYRLLSVAVAALVAALVLPTPLSRRVRDGVQSDPYAYDRVQIWAAAARLASTNLWRGGVGLGSFADAALAHKFPVERAFGRYQKSPNHAHNEYLQLLAEASLPGLALLLVPVVLAVQRGVRAVHAGGADAPRAAICLGGTAAILTHAGVEVVLHSPAVLYALAALLGLLLALRPRSDAPAPAARVVAHLVVASIWLGTVLTPWLGDRAVRAYVAGGAEPDLARAIRLVPGHAGYRRAAATRAAAAYRRSGRLEDFEATLWHGDQAVRLQPIAARHRSFLASFQHEAFLERWPRGEIAARALGEYDAALVLDPTNALLLGARALLLASLGRIDDAEASIRRALELEPNYRTAHEFLARIHDRRGERAERAAALNAVARIEEYGRRHGATSPYERALIAPSGPAP